MADTMKWSTLLRGNVDKFLLKMKRKSNPLSIMLSPDIDGIVSTVLLALYAKNTHGVQTVINGTYDAKRITVVGTTNVVEESIWVDLDLPMKDCFAIGQHLLGDVQEINDLSWNPNLHFSNNETWTKYPFGSAQMLFHALPLSVPPGGKQEALLAHCDSTLFNIMKYKANSKNWIERMYPTSVLMSRMLAGTYKKEMIDVHSEMVKDIEPFVTIKKKWRGPSHKGWDACRSRQTANGTKKKPKEGMANLKALVEYVADQFNCDTITFRGSVDSTTVLWTGRNICVPLYKKEVQEKGIGNYLSKINAKSHTIINSRMLSLTLEEVEL
jgi:hypothetical protein